MNSAGKAAVITALSAFIFLFGYTDVYSQQNETRADAAQNIQTSEVKTEGAAVSPFGSVLFKIYGDVGSVTAQMRAKTVEENIVKLKKDLLFKPELLSIKKNDDSVNIVYKDKIITGVTEQQAHFAGKSRTELALEYKDVISKAIETERSKNYIVIMLEQIGLIVLLLLLLYFSIKYINILHGKIQSVIAIRKEKSTGIINNIVDFETQQNIIRVLIKTLRFLLAAAVLYAGFLALLEIFPKTRHIADVSIGYIIVPLKKIALAVWHYIPDLIDIILILVIFNLLNRLLRTISVKIASGKIKLMHFHPDWAAPTYQLSRVILAIFTFIFIFPHLPNSDSAGFKGMSVFLGVLLSLGSTSLISNVVSGLVITYMRPFKVGDRIKMGEHVGDVIEKNTLVTRLKTSKNEIITIPNSKIMTTETINYTSSATTFGLILHTSVTMGYEVSWRKVHKLLIEAGLKTEGVLKNPEPFVLQKEFDNSYIQYQINVYTDKAAGMVKMHSALHENIQDVFNREGIELMTPNINAVRDGSAIAIPKEYLQPDNMNVDPIKISEKDSCEKEEKK